MAITYAFKDDAAILKNGKKADPQRIGEELSKIKDAHAGRLEPDHVVNAAKSTKNVLHPHFEWNDSVAAHAHRVQQARHLISLVVEVTDTGEPRRAYTSIADNGRSYRHVDEIVESKSLQLIVLQQAERELRAFERRYHMLQDICELVRTAREKVAEKQSKIESRAAA